MTPFLHLTAPAAPLMRPNIDTDVIIPSREMKTVSKTGLGAGAFANWRYSDVDARIPDPDFVLNQRRYTGAQILVAGQNFGCGSSREHAIWALKDLGIKAVIAPSFGAIFEKNCVMNGLAPLRITADAASHLAETLEEGDTELSIDLEQMRVRSTGTEHPIDLDEGYRAMLINGWDAIGVLLQHAAAIDQWRKTAAERWPWVTASLSNQRAED